MNLTYKNYIAKVVNDRFDLSQIKAVTAKADSKEHKKGDEYEAEVEIGYSYTFDGLLRKIAHLEMGKKNDMTIGEYIDEFKLVLKDIKSWMNT